MNTGDIFSYHDHYPLRLPLLDIFRQRIQRPVLQPLGGGILVNRRRLILTHLSAFSFTFALVAPRLALLELLAGKFVTATYGCSGEEARCKKTEDVATQIDAP